MYALGVDIGSTASKVMILDMEGNIASSAIVGFGAGTSGSQKAVEQAFSQIGIGWEDIGYTVSTGYGRNRFEKSDKQISELSCHAKGIAKLIPGVRTVIDIGGQDVKVLQLSEDGVLENFIMNEKCAAGTGRFLDVMARVLESSTDQLGALDAQSTQAVEISSTCTVFAESEVISHLADGADVADIVAGIHDSVAHRTAGLAKRVGIVPIVGMSGGVAQNSGVVRALEQALGQPIHVPPNTQLVGAYGAALMALKKCVRK